MAASNQLLRADNTNPIWGNDLDVPVTVSNWPSSVTPTKAWLTIKSTPTAADASGTQFILSSSGDFNITGDQLVMTFVVANTDFTSITAGTNYYYGIKTLGDDGKIRTIIAKGQVQFDPDVTIATS
jgi:hypothetical protein